MSTSRLVDVPSHVLRNPQMGTMVCPKPDHHSCSVGHPLESKCARRLARYVATQVVENNTSLESELVKLVTSVPSFSFEDYDFDAHDFKKVVGVGAALGLIRKFASDYLRLGEFWRCKACREG